ncbi:MAG: transglutaminase-like domain-containing protein [Burkholderiaceae bacterium]
MTGPAEKFMQLVAGTGPIDLTGAVAAIATDAYPESTLDRACAQMNAWCERLRDRVAPELSSAERLRQLNRYFFDELRFRGNRVDYFDPDNNYLNRVLERRTGLPISISVVYIVLGRAIGLDLVGVNFPRRFLVKLMAPEPVVVIDVFDGGATLSPEELRSRLAQAHGAEAGPLETYLRPASEREILIRWLYNLKLLHQRREDWAGLLAVGQRLVALLPGAVDELLDRAAAYEKLECPRAAADDIATVLQRQPGRPDAAALRERLARLEGHGARLN